MKVNRFFKTVLMVGMMLALTVTTTHAATLADIQNQMMDKQKLLNQGQQTVKKLGSEISDMQKGIDNTQGEIDKLAGKISSTNEQISKMEKSLNEQKEKWDKGKKNLNKRLRNMYKSGNVGFWDVILGSGNVQELLSNMEMVKYVYGGDKKLVQDLKKQHDDIQAKKKELDDIKGKLTADKTSMDGKVQKLNGDKKALADKQAKVASNNSVLQKDIDALSAEAKKIQAAINTQPEYVPPKPDGGGSNPGSTGGGRLLWPVPSSRNVTSGYGWRYFGGSSDFHTGLDIAAASGSAVVAAEAGKVMQAYYNSSYGNMILISHGNGLYTLYAHNSALYVGTGAIVSRGQRIAAIGSTGNSTGPHLHFEVRLKSNWGSDVNPYGYL